jgi:hypothetical protein
MTVRIRVPSSCDLVLEPQLGPLVLLEIAAVVTSNALRGQHVQIEGHPFHETEEVAAARSLAGYCDVLRCTIREYRRLVIERLRAEQSDWPF